MSMMHRWSEFNKNFLVDSFFWVSGRAVCRLLFSFGIFYSAALLTVNDFANVTIFVTIVAALNTLLTSSISANIFGRVCKESNPKNKNTIILTHIFLIALFALVIGSFWVVLDNLNALSVADKHENLIFSAMFVCFLVFLRSVFEGFLLAVKAYRVLTASKIIEGLTFTFLLILLLPYGTFSDFLLAYVLANIASTLFVAVSYCHHTSTLIPNISVFGRHLTITVNKFFGMAAATGVVAFLIPLQLQAVSIFNSAHLSVTSIASFGLAYQVYGFLMFPPNTFSLFLLPQIDRPTTSFFSGVKNMRFFMIFIFAIYGTFAGLAVLVLSPALSYFFEEMYDLSDYLVLIAILLPFASSEKMAGTILISRGSIFATCVLHAVFALISISVFYLFFKTLLAAAIFLSLVFGYIFLAATKTSLVIMDKAKCSTN